MPPLAPPPSKLPAQIKSPLKAKPTNESDAQCRASGVDTAESGLQPSNVTSAIRSQVISSTAGAPFVKAGTSKEVHGLKRKVLEKNVGPALNTIHTRQPSIERFDSGRAEVQMSRARLQRRKPSEPLVEIHEESTEPLEDDNASLAADSTTKALTKSTDKPKKDAKPGYCENCREKYDDFDDVSSDTA